MTQRASARAERPDPPVIAVNRAAVGVVCATCATRERCLIGARPQLAAHVGPQISERAFQQGETLMRENERASHVRLMKLGTVFVCRDGADGAPQPLAMGARGMVFGLCGYAMQPNQVSAVAITAGRYCELPVETIQSLAQNDSVFRERVGKALIDKVGFMARWAQLRGHRGVVAQVAGSLALIVDEQRSAAIEIPSHSALAKMMGTTRETVARALAALEAQGCLTRRGGRRCEVDAPRLREWLAAHS